MALIVVDTDEYFSMEETAELLGKGIATLWRMVRDGRLMVLRPKGSRRTLVPKSEIERLRDGK